MGGEGGRRGCPSSFSLPLGDPGLLGPMLPSLLRCAVATTASLASYFGGGGPGRLVLDSRWPLPRTRPPGGGLRGE